MNLASHDGCADTAQGGLNLNIFGALSGALSSKSRKETHTNPDGSKKAVEDRDTKGVYYSVFAALRSVMSHLISSRRTSTFLPYCPRFILVRYKTLSNLMLTPRSGSAGSGAG